jgi:hypothetical protein
MSRAGSRREAPPTRLGQALTDAARAAGPPLLFGLRLSRSLRAGTSAALVCQPHLAAPLRKGWYRMIGTLVGAVAIVVLTACFPQDRAAFLVGLALWGAACALVATLLRNFAAYSTALARYTAAIIASDQLGATGGLNGEAFILAVTRASEICIGIVSAGIVHAGTDLVWVPRGFASPSCLPPCRSRSRTDSQARCCRRDRNGRRHSRFDVISSGAPLRSTQPSTRLSGSPQGSATIRRYCERLLTVCSLLWPLGVR